MEPFLKLVAKDILAKSNGNMANYTLVFPNRRSVLYFNKYLAQVVDKPLWAPQCITISEFVEQLSTLRKADDLLLLFDLHKIYNEVRGTTESFDNFYYWGELMLSDFDDIDKYLVDAQNLFQNLSALKNLNEQFSFLDEGQIEAIRQFWKNFGESKESAQHKGFSDLWSGMYTIYNTFHENLKLKDLAYEGQIYRHVTETIDSGNLKNITFDKIAFIGFNALNECEKRIFKYFQSIEKAYYYWDFDPKFIENPIHEAGFFIRQNLQLFPSSFSEDIVTNLQTPGIIECIAIPSFVGQAKMLNSLVADNNLMQDKEENLAILLTDENLLVPVLHSLPGNIDEINITMGYPLKNSPVFALIESIGRLHLSSKSQNNNANFYYKNVLEILQHPYLIRQYPQESQQLVNKIQKGNIIYVPHKALIDNELHAIIFSQFSNSYEFIRKIADVIKWLGNNLQKSNVEAFEQPFGIEHETLIVVYSSLNRFSDLVKEYNEQIETALCFRILMKKLKELTIPFQGEPLKGVQVMGFLESRALDFENLVILGVNEGNLPKTNTPPSFIPYNLRYGFGLPTLEYRDAMYAYYFYRLLHRSKNVFLLYNTKADKMGSAEVSRYITQLTLSKNYQVIHKTQTFSISSIQTPKIEIAKTEKVLTKLNKYTIGGSSPQKYLSPSALSSYMNCSLQFYFRYIEDLKEFEKPVEEIDASTLGNILHKCMQKLYKPYIGLELTKSLLVELAKDTNRIENTLTEEICNELQLDITDETNKELKGRNYIIFNILKKYISQILEIDKFVAPLQIKQLEYNITLPFNISQNSKKIELVIGGNIDRIDETKNSIRIIDYKTGNVDNKINSIVELFENNDLKKDKKEIFQTLLYSLIYKNHIEDIKPVKPGIYSVREIFTDEFDASLIINKQKIFDIKFVEKEFSENLHNLLEEIYNSSVPFSQTEDPKKCQYCDFKTICHKN